MLKPFIKRIRIYPIKSLDPIAIQKSDIGIRSLKHDRSFAMLAEDGRFVNGKRTGLVNTLKAEYDIENSTVKFSQRNEDQKFTFELRESNDELNDFLSNYFNIKLFLLHRTKGELMDIPSASREAVFS